MTPDDDNETVLYEVNLDAEAGIEGPFDTWLRDHIADVLQFDGFLSAEVLDDATAPEGRIRRIVQYRLRNQAALEAYLREHAPRMRAQGVEKFGERYTATRRVLAHREEFIRGAFSTENCLNCGEVLRGQHCSHCGQRAKVRVLSLGTLLRDLLGDLTNFDSRIWRTLKPLAFRPGSLTVEYLRGRRTHYSPPFRMYLILSVVFFVLTTLGGNPGSAIVFDLDDQGGANVQIVPSGDAPRTDGVPGPRQHADRGCNGPSDARHAAGAGPGAAAGRRCDREAHAAARTGHEARAELEQDLGSTLGRRSSSRCSGCWTTPARAENLNFGFGPEREGIRRQAARRLPQDHGRLQLFWTGGVRQHPEDDVHLPAADRGRDVRAVPGLGALLRRAPAVLRALPLVLLPRRHRRGAARPAQQTFLRGRMAVRRSMPCRASSPSSLFAYVPWYLYRAMRRVYGQGRVVTLLKFSLLGLGYLFFMTLTAVGLVLYTALTL